MRNQVQIGMCLAVLLSVASCTAPNYDAGGVDDGSGSASTPPAGGATGTTTGTTGGSGATPTPPPPELIPFALTAASVPASPTNAYANDATAQALGRAIFFDPRLSADGTIACVSCHDPAKGFSDSRVFSAGVGGQLGARHSLPIFDAVFHPYLFWDGRADSAWSQPLKAIENTKEMAFTRVGVAHLVDSSYHAGYEAVFGALPDLSAYPDAAMPGMAAWDGLSSAQQDTAQRIFANVGKALEAYERQLICADTRFDRWVRGEVTPTAAELTGARTFVGRHCIGCHAGPSFSDGQFHNVGIASSSAQPDNGRADAAALLEADPFNGAGAYSDDPTAGAHKLAGLAQERGTLGAFRTPTLRGAGQRTPFDQRGSQTTLVGFITNTYRRPHLEPGAVGTLDPRLQGVGGGNEPELAAFIHMLDCPPVAPSLLAP